MRLRPSLGTAPSTRARALLVSIALAFAGCLAPAGDHLERAARAGAIAPAFEQDHDHLDPALHAFSSGIELVSYHNLVPGSTGEDASERGAWLTSEVIVRGEHAYVGYLGGAARVAIVDIADEAKPVLQGTFDTGQAWTMDLSVSADGDWIYASFTTGAIGTLFATDYLFSNPDAPTGPAGPGVAVIDARDRANPVLSSFFPVHGLGPHTAVLHEYPDGREILFASKAEGGGVGNAIVILEVVETPAGGRALEPLAVFQAPQTEGMRFSHDVDVQEHPVTGRTILSSAYFEGGLVIVDVTDPASPVLVSQFTDFPAGEESAVHDVHPFPRLVAGKHYTLSAPEIAAEAATGHLRVFDTTDPASPVLVGGWTLPGDFLVQQFSFSPHNFQFLPDGRVALAHGHAGVWIVDWLGPGGETAPDPAWIAAPRAAAYYVPHEPVGEVPAWDPVRGAPWVWGTAVDERGLVWASDVASGLYGLRVTGSA